MTGELALDDIMAAEDEAGPTLEQCGFTTLPASLQMAAPVAEEQLAPEVKQPQTTGEIMTRMFEIRDERKELSDADSELKEEWDALELELITALDAQGSDRASKKGLGSAGITETVLPNVDDWDEYYAYIKENDAFHLLQRRPATAAYRELIESGQSIPGTHPITKRAISLKRS